MDEKNIETPEVNLLLLTFVRQINEMVDQRANEKLAVKVKDPYQSEQINELVTALAKAQGDYQVIGKNKTNPFFKSQFADYDSIMSSVRPFLSKNGLVLSQYTVIDSDTRTRTLHSRLMHASGQWIESRETITPEDNNDQKWASTLSYKKRHQAMAILNITISDDPTDDDAETNMQQTRVEQFRGTAINHNYSPADQPEETINTHEHKQLSQALQGWPDMCKAILDRYKISTLADLPKNKYEHVIKQIRVNVEQRTKGSDQA